MPQLDIYIFQELVVKLLIFWYLIYIINSVNLLLEINLSLKVIKLKFFIEKQYLNNVYKEINIIKNNKYLKKIILKIINIYLNIKIKIFKKNLLDIYNVKNLFLDFLIFMFKDNKNGLKNNIELYRIII